MKCGEGIQPQIEFVDTEQATDQCLGHTEKTIVKFLSNMRN